MKKERLIKTANIVLFVLLCFFMLTYTFQGSVWRKGSCSLCFVLSGLLHLRKCEGKSQKFPLFFFAGQVVAFAGDILINHNFVAGAALFAGAHILYIIAYFTLQKLRKNNIPCWIALAILSGCILTFVPFLAFPDGMYAVCLIYGLIISVMTSKAICNYWDIRNKLFLVLCIGSILFYLSDIMTLFCTFATVPGPYGMFGNFLYFPGQFLLAQSIDLYYTQEYRKEDVS